MCLCVCVRECICVCVHACVCGCVGACMCAWVRRYVGACMHCIYRTVSPRIEKQNGGQWNLQIKDTL